MTADRAHLRGGGEFTAALAAEWTKLRTVRATGATLAATVAVSAGLAAFVGYSFSSHDLDADPLFATFYSLTLGQLPLVVLGVLAVGAEYRTGTIQISLLAVPERARLYAAKLAAVGAAALAVSGVTVLATFFAAQATLDRHGTSLGAPGTPTAIAGACAYLTLICLFATGVTTALRSSVGALVALLPLLFLDSQGLGNVPYLKTVLQYLPDEAGMVILHLTRPGDPRFGRDFGPWTGVAIMTLWTVAALLGGYLVLRRRDA